MGSLLWNHQYQRRHLICDGSCCLTHVWSQLWEAWDVNNKRYRSHSILDRCCNVYVFTSFHSSVCMYSHNPQVVMLGSVHTQRLISVTSLNSLTVKFYLISMRVLVEFKGSICVRAGSRRVAGEGGAEVPFICKLHAFWKMTVINCMLFDTLCKNI